MRKFVSDFGFAACALSLMPLLAGCPEPAKAFDDFVKRSPAPRIVDMALPPSSAFDVTGTFLLSISTVIDPDKPIVFRATNVLTANADGTAALDMTLQALSEPKIDENKNMKPDRKPVGNPIVLKALPVDKTGNFSADLGMQMVVGTANPISGSEITATLKLIGSIRSKDRMCGAIEGMLINPFAADLKGSTWGAFRFDTALMGEDTPPSDFSCGGGGGDMAMPATMDMSVPADLVSTAG